MADPTIDLAPAAATLAGIVRAVPDAALAGPTPCPGYTVAGMLDHVDGLALAFTAAAAKEPLDGAPAVGGTVAEGWRERIPARLEALAAAWADPAAWDGMTAAGGVDLPGAVCGLVALDEVVVHGWDLAAATGQDPAWDGPTLEAVLGFVGSFEPPADGPAEDGGLFGPPVAVPGDAPLLHRVLGLTGRDPGWAPPG
jgi:uncharacterized protein (TIGR03086 family)